MCIRSRVAKYRERLYGARARPYREHRNDRRTLMAFTRSDSRSLIKVSERRAAKCRHDFVARDTGIATMKRAGDISIDQIDEGIDRRICTRELIDDPILS